MHQRQGSLISPLEIVQKQNQRVLIAGKDAKEGPEHKYVTHLVRAADVPSTERNVGDNWHSDQSPRYRPSLGFLLDRLDLPG